MPAAGQAVSGVEEVLRARANARRIKEHYEGTLGVPSELQTLSHLLAHDKDAVFAGLENLPFYNKCDVPAPPAPPAPESAQPAQPAVPRRRSHGLPSGAPPRYDGRSSPLGAPMRTPSPSLALEPWDSDPAKHEAAETQQQAQSTSQFPLPPLPSADLQQQPEYPAEPGAGPGSPGRVRLPSGLSVDPWRWAPSADTGQSLNAATSAVAATPGSSGSLGQLQPAGGSGPLQRPDSRAGTAASATSSRQPSRQASPTARGHSGASAYFGLTLSEVSAAGPGPGSGWGSGSVLGSPMPSAAVEAPAPVVVESEEERKYRMAKQRLLSAHDLSPQEWARIGPPQDAADLEKFTARSYQVSVDFDRQTLMPKRVARPDIFHISADEAQRRQMEADEATLALQAQRRAEMEAEEQAAEAERLAREAARGPRYDALGVRQVDRSVSPVLPRYLDWHPGSVGGLTATGGGGGGRPPLPTGRRSHSGGSGGGAAAASTSVSPRGSRCPSAARAGSDPAAAIFNAYGGGFSRGASLPEQQFGKFRQTEPPVGSDPYVYEDLGDDAGGADAELAAGAAYGTRPPTRRHHSAMAGSYAPPPRPPGVTDAHYAQMVRQQRKWLNAPVQPPRPVSAAPFPAPMSSQYVRPRSSRPPPDGTAAPIPSRVAAEAAAVAAAAESVNRPNSAFRTVITQRPQQQLPPRPHGRGGTGGGRARANWGPTSTSSRPASASPSATSYGPALPNGGSAWAAAASNIVRQGSGGVRPVSATATVTMVTSGEPVVGGGSGAGQPPQGLPHMQNGKKLPWEAREHVAAAAAVGIIPPRLVWDASDAAAAAAAVAANPRRASTTSSNSRSRGGSTARQRSQQQSRPASVFGETLPPEGAGKDGEQYAPRKFEIRNEMVLDAYMGR